jgi:hypothetical protein
MPGRTIELPKSVFALEIDGRLKAEFSTKEGAEHGATELKRRFPMLQIRIYDGSTQLRPIARARPIRTQAVLAAGASQATARGRWRLTTTPN